MTCLESYASKYSVSCGVCSVFSIVIQHILIYSTVFLQQVELEVTASVAGRIDSLQLVELEVTLPAVVNE